MNARTTLDLNLRVTLVLDIPARDYIDAADHQQRIEEHLKALRTDYPQALLEIRDRKPTHATPNRGAVRTGKLHSYG